MCLVDEISCSADPARFFSLVRDVENWPRHLNHYRFVRFRERSGDGGGLVEMSAYRPFGVLKWPTWWLSEMSVHAESRTVRFTHVGGVTREMDVEWSVHASGSGTHVRLVHVWNGPRWPVIGGFTATRIIGPLFVHAIASRTMAGLASAATAGPAAHDSTADSA
jgi:ribosome-associated toxin RatA of RatAB toxin-antitoxin module